MYTFGICYFVICYLYNCTIHHMLHSTYLCVCTVAAT